MDNKKLGIMLVIAGIVIALIIFSIKLREDAVLDKIIVEQGSCFLEDGTCLHDRTVWPFVLGWILSAAIVSLGVYLIFFEKAQRELVSALEKHKQMKVEEEKFSILLKGLSEEEKLILNAVKEQDGITQQTLRLRTGLHKSKLSIVLDGMEKKGIIARVEKGKTNQIFLKINL